MKVRADVSGTAAAAGKRAGTGRSTAGDRRQAIVAAALEEFALGGLAGSSTEAVARRAGISQPYVFRLFGTKKSLFLEVVRYAFTRTRATFDEAASRYRAGGIDNCPSVLGAMGLAYIDLLEDRTLLLIQLQAYAASSDPEVRDCVRDEYVELQRFVAESSGADAADVRRFFAEGMLLNIEAALKLESRTT